jgi:hypothetical protein
MSGDASGAVVPVVTLELLEALGACEDYRDRFRDYFGDRVVVTREVCEAVSDWVLWYWAVEHLLTPEGRSAYCPVFDSVTVPCTCSGTSSERAARFADVATRYGVVTVEQAHAYRTQAVGMVRDDVVTLEQALNGELR